MWSWFIGAVGILLSFIFDRKRKADEETEYARTKKENLEVRSENEALKKREKQKAEWDKAKEEWQELNEDEKTERILDRFRNSD